jgi:hypothetical protein
MYPLERMRAIFLGILFSAAECETPDLGDEYYYWFPAEMVIDPFTGAVDYVPLA